MWNTGISQLAKSISQSLKKIIIIESEYADVERHPWNVLAFWSTPERLYVYHEWFLNAKYLCLYMDRTFQNDIQTPRVGLGYRDVTYLCIPISTVWIFLLW